MMNNFIRLRRYLPTGIPLEEMTLSIVLQQDPKDRCHSNEYFITFWGIRHSTLF